MKGGIFMDYKNKIVELLKAHVKLDIETIESLIEIPPKSEMGDYTFPCVQLSKVMKKAPNIIAEELRNTLSNEGFERIENIGPYLNFFINKGVFSENVINKILEQRDDYGASNIGEGKTVCIEYSSQSIAKHFHVGHLFAGVIGNALYKMFKKEGYNTIGINHLGDFCKQFGKLMCAYNKWIDEEALEKAPIDELRRIYVKFNEESEKDSSLEDEARENFKALKNGDRKATTIWNRFRELSLKEFKRGYDILGVKFDSQDGEAFYNDKIKAVIDELKGKDLLVESNGAKVVNLKEYNMPPCIVLKDDDGISMYAARDLAVAMYRKKTYDFYKSIYVVGIQQALYFKQVFKVLEAAGHEWSKDCVHVGFGLVKFADRKLFTRNSSVILLQDLLCEAVEKTMKVIKEREEVSNKEEAAKKIGIGSVIFTYLKNSREKDIVFNWKDILSFDGDTVLYIQCAYVRGNSILTAAGECERTASYRKLSSKEEFELIKNLSNFNNVIKLALEKLEPSVLARYVIEVVKGLNKFYNGHSVLNLNDEHLKAARLNLIKASLQVIKNGLDLLGIEM